MLLNEETEESSNGHAALIAVCSFLHRRPVIPMEVSSSHMLIVEQVLF
jgi:hypothetical protein